MLENLIGKDTINAMKEGISFTLKKANEAAEESKAHTGLLTDILEELKTLNRALKGGKK